MKNLLCLLVLLLVVPQLKAVAQAPVETECGTYQALQEQNSSAGSFQAKERIKLAKLVSEDPQLRGVQQTVKVIPVVVHVIHDYTSSTNISKAKIEDGLRMLNDDFNKRNPDTALVVAPFKPLIANVQVEFRLATLDPNGNCTQGITRTYSPLTHTANNNVKGLIQWDPASYLNIWVVGAISSGAGAYSSFPCGNPATDGIVVRADRLGFTYSHTISHEVGHYLNLDHTWGQGPVGQASNCSTDDGIADTPNTIGGSTPVCNTSQVHCGNLVNIQNMMDYGGCLIMFTLGQKAVMQDALLFASCRTSLWSPGNLLATGTAGASPSVACVPIPDFTASSTRICEGASIQLTDLTYNAQPDSTWSWLWTFAGGTPAVSAAQNPQVTFPNPGIYAVSLTVSNSAGSNSITRTNYLEVMATTTALQAPFMESFERTTFPEFPGTPQLNCQVESSTTNTWQQTNSASLDSVYSMRIRHQFIPANQLNSLITPNIHLAGLAQPTLQFAVAYAPSNSSLTGTDYLRIFTSVNCGQSWEQQYVKGGIALATAAASAPNTFVPAANDWRTETVALPTAPAYLMLKIETVSGNGSVLYLDAVRVIEGNTTGMAGTELLQNLTVYPNPTYGHANLRYQLQQESQVRLRLISSTGKVLADAEQLQHPGRHEQELHALTGALASGVYLLQLTTANEVRTVKLAVY